MLSPYIAYANEMTQDRGWHPERPTIWLSGGEEGTGDWGQLCRQWFNHGSLMRPQ